MDYQSSDAGFELLAILLVSHGSGGAHLLFKYPFSNEKPENNAVLCINKDRDQILHKNYQINLFKIFTC